MSGNTVSLETPYFAFGAFLVDVRRRRVTKDGTPVPLTARVFDTLVLLIQRRNDVVGKEEFFESVWQGAAVEENNLVRTISTLRKALGEEPSEHRYVVTIPGRGYRFVAEVTTPEALPLGESLETKVRTIPDSAPLSRFSWKRTWPMGAVASVLIIVGAWWLLREPTSTVPTRIRQLTFEQGLQESPTWSPDGQMIAYSSDRSGSLDIWAQRLDGGAPRQITSGPDQDWQPNWSPDGRRIVFRSERDGGGIWLVSVSGGLPERLTRFGYQPRWAPGGKHILFDRSNAKGNMVSALELYVVGVDGSPPRRVATETLKEVTSFTAAWHPNGTHVSLWGALRTGDMGFWTVSIVDGSTVRSEIPASALKERRAAGVRFTDSDLLPLPFRWSSQGDALFFEGLADGVRNLWRVAVNPRSLAWSGSLERLTTSAGVDQDPAISPDGRSLAFASRDERVRLWSFPFDASAGRITGIGTPLTSPEVNALSPDLSPNGERVVFNVERGSDTEIHELSLIDGKDIVLYSSKERARWSAPRWAPDSENVLVRRVTTANQKSNTEIVLLNASGREAVLSTLNSVLEFPFDWSSDGEWILGGARQQNRGPFALSFFPVVQREPAAAIRPLATDAHSNLWQARLSPDQRWVATAAAKPGSSSIILIPVDGGRWSSVTTGDYFDDRPRWSPDGRVLYFLSNRTGFLNVWARRIDLDLGVPIGAPFQVTHFDSPITSMSARMIQVGLALSDDRLILPMMHSSGNIWLLEGLHR